METKQNIRNKVLKERSLLPKDFRRMADEIILQRIQELPEYQNADVVLLFCGYGSEVNTTMLITQTLQCGKEVYVPKVLDSYGDMEFYRIQSLEQLIPGFHNIPEPNLLNNLKPFMSIYGKKGIMIMPGVSFDEKGHRIGYGKGYYDRYLEKLMQAKYNPVKIAIGYEMQFLQEQPYDENDISFDIGVSEVKIRIIKK